MFAIKKFYCPKLFVTPAVMLLLYANATPEHLAAFKAEWIKKKRTAEKASTTTFGGSPISRDGGLSITKSFTIH